MLWLPYGLIAFLSHHSRGDTRSFDKPLIESYDMYPDMGQPSPAVTAEHCCAVPLHTYITISQISQWDTQTGSNSYFLQ